MTRTYIRRCIYVCIVSFMYTYIMYRYIYICVYICILYYAYITMYQYTYITYIIYIHIYIHITYYIYIYIHTNLSISNTNHLENSAKRTRYSVSLSDSINILSFRIYQLCLCHVKQIDIIIIIILDCNITFKRQVTNFRVHVESLQ